MYVGIDPGASGAIAVIDKDHNLIRIESFVNRSKSDLHHLLGDIDSKWTLKHVYLEKVHSMPRDGVKSAFSFGRVYGHIEMLLTALYIPYGDVIPQKWQQKLSMGAAMERTARKKLCKEKAQQWFPAQAKNITLTVADAVCIAEYAYRMHHE